MTEEKLAGVVRSFDMAKGYGYIEVEGLTQPVFVHYQSIVDDRYQVLRPGEAVELVLDDAPEGPRAVDVRRL